jgi:xanthine/CO dehydrogenase XdhC/CoxF family maturation factor
MFSQSLGNQINVLERRVSEAARLVALSRRARARGEQLCLATVVHVEGSAYRKPGARMLLASGGERSGTISGGCLESEVSRKAWWLTAQGPRVERYSSFADEDGGMPYGLGCGGTISLLLEQGEPAEAVLAAIEQVLELREPAVVIISLGIGSQSPELLATESGSTGTGGGWGAAGAEDAPGGGSATLAAAGPGQAGTLAVLRLPRGGGRAGMEEMEAWGGMQPASLERAYLRSPWSSAGRSGPPAEPGIGSLPADLERAARTAFLERRSSHLTSSFSPCPAAVSGAEPGSAPAYFVEYLGAPPSLSIFGAGDDAQPIAELAHALGWRVGVADGRAHLARRERFPQAAEVRVLDYADPALRAACGMPGDALPQSPAQRLGIKSANGNGIGSGIGLGLGSGLEPGRGMDASPLVSSGSGLATDDLAIILTHSYEQDRALLLALLPCELRYLGILGPRHRTQRLLEEVTPSLGLSVGEGFARLHSPIGLDLGAGDPAAVALSIAAEIQAVLHGRQVRVTHAGPEPVADGPTADLASGQLA